MKRLFGTLVTAAAIIAACSDSDDAPPATPLSDASATPPTDSTAAEASGEGSVPDASAALDRICSDDNWCHTEPPAKHSLLDAWGDGQGNLWAASVIDPGEEDEHGGIARFDGKAWSPDYEEPKGKLVAIWGSSATDLWAGGVNGLLHGDGTTWTPVAIEDGFQVEDITGSAAGGLWVVGTSALSEARAYHRAPGGTAWDRVSIVAPDAGSDTLVYSEIRAVWIVESGDIWISARSGRDYLLRRRAAGTTWSVIPTPTDPFQYTGVGPVADNPWILGFTFRGGAAYWNAKADLVADAGDWTAGRWKGTDPTADQIRRYAVWGLAANDLWSAGSFALIDHFDGTTWTLARTSVDDRPIADDVVALWGTSNEDLWAIGGHTALHKVSAAEAARLEAAKDGGP